VNAKSLFSGKNHNYSVVLVFDISVVKESRTCYFYSFSGPKRRWLRNLCTMKMCRLVLFSH